MVFLAALRLLAWCLSLAPAGAELRDALVGDSLVQMSARVKSRAAHAQARKAADEPLCAPVRMYYHGNQVVAMWCGFNITSPSSFKPAGPQQELDLDRPLRDVQREHPGNLFRYFGKLNQWIGPGMADVDGKGYRGYKSFLTNPTLPFKDGKEPKVTFRWDGLQISTHHDNCQVADDPYCYSLGWMKGQALDKKYDLARLMDNATAWNDLGAEECKRMKEEFKFDDDNITLGGHIRETNDIYVKTERTCDWHEPSPGPPVAVRDFKKHAYAKCFMNNVTTEMAYCYFRGCVREGNSIGHASQCSY